MNVFIRGVMAHRDGYCWDFIDTKIDTDTAYQYSAK